MLPHAAKCCQMLPDAIKCCQMLPDSARCCQMREGPEYASSALAAAAREGPGYASSALAAAAPAPTAMREGPGYASSALEPRASQEQPKPQTSNFHCQGFYRTGLRFRVYNMLLGFLSVSRLLAYRDYRSALAYRVERCGAVRTTRGRARGICRCAPCLGFRV